MELRQLEYFVRIADCGSVSRAAAELRVAQPALSRQVRQLEDELQAELFRRSGRGVELTDAGRALLVHARSVLQQLQQAREDVGQAQRHLLGAVRVGLPPAIAKRLAVPLARRFREQLPQSTLSIAEALSASLQDQLLAGHLDLALLYNPVWTPELHLQLLLEEDFCLVRPRRGSVPTPPVTLRELAEEPLVIPTRTNAIRTLVDAQLARLGLRPRIACEVDGVGAILDLVADGAGSAVLSVHAVPASGRAELFSCSQVVEPRLRSALTLATPARREATPAQAAAAQLLREIAGELPAAVSEPASDAASRARPT